jgi:hypothetical protein
MWATEVIMKAIWKLADLPRIIMRGPCLVERDENYQVRDGRDRYIFP